MHERATSPQETLLIGPGNEQFPLNCVNKYSLVMCDTTYNTRLPNSPLYSNVTGGNKAGVDLVLIQPFLLCYVNHVLMLTSIFKA